MASLEPIFAYWARLQGIAREKLKYGDDDPEQKSRSHSFSTYRQHRRKRSLITRYGFFSALTCEGYMAQGFSFLMEVITGRRLAFLLSTIMMCWLMVFIRLSFVEVWQYSAVEDYRRGIRKNMMDIDTSLTQYRLIRPLGNDHHHFHVHQTLDTVAQDHAPHFKKKVLVFAYKHGGGSVFAQMFNQDPNAMLWYEALDPFYASMFGVKPNVNPRRVTENSDATDRELVKSERKWLSDYFRHMYFCQTHHLPLELVIHNYMLDLKASSGFRECVTSLNSPHIDETMDNCSSTIQDICGPTVEHAIRMQCPTILHAGMKLRDTIRQMEGDLDVYLADTKITEALEKVFDELLGPVQHSLPAGFSQLFPKFLRHQFCLAGLEQALKPCAPHVTDTCNGKTLGVAHVVRLKSEDLRFILRDFPTMTLVLYVRDPRAIAYSRMALDGEAGPGSAENLGKRIVQEARELCPRMLADYWELVKLQHKFPKVSFTMVKYEDMVLYPYELALEFYNHMSMFLPESYRLYVEAHMIVDKAEYLFGSVNPGTAGNNTLHHWRDTLNKNEIRDINKHCRDILELFQYGV